MRTGETAKRREIYTVNQLQTVTNLASRDLYGDGDPSAGAGRAWAAYKLPGFEAINARLRIGEPPSRDDVDRIAQFGKWKLEKDAIVYRGIKPPATGDPYQPLRPLDIYAETAYLSTSYTKGQARRFAGRGGYFFEIAVPKNAAFVAPDIPGALGYLNNREVTFPPGSQMLVREVATTPGKQTHFDVVLLPPGAPKPSMDDDFLAYAEDAWEAWNATLKP